MRSGIMAIVLAMMCPVDVQAEGLFDLLFGARPQTAPTVRYAAREVGPVVRRAPPAELGIPSLEELSSRHVRRYAEPDRPRPYVAPPVMSGHLGRFLRDPTLRPGDVVATEKGLMVYNGPGGSQHSENQFVAVTSAKRLVGDKLPLLVKMDRELKRSPLLTAEQAPVPTSTITASAAAGYRPQVNPCRPGFICREARAAPLMR